MLLERVFANIQDEYSVLQTECDKIFFDVIEIKDRLNKHLEFDESDYRRFGMVV